jgi:hypothetical protein
VFLWRQGFLKQGKRRKGVILKYHPSYYYQIMV